MGAKGPVAKQVGGCATDFVFYSIAMTANKFYYSTPQGTLNAADLTETPLALNNCKLLASGIYTNSLAVNSRGILYFTVDNNLYSLDPANPALVLVGALPFSSLGDLVFYDDQLFMASAEGIDEISLTDPAKSTVYIPLPGNLTFGLAVAPVNGKLLLYALAANKATSAVSDIFALDMQTKTVTGVAGQLPFFANDGASEVNLESNPPIFIQNTEITQVCALPNTATVQIVCAPHTATYTFTLSTGQSNNTGIFNQLPQGNYTATVTSSSGVPSQTVDFNVPDYAASNPQITETQTNPMCGLTGTIKLDAGATTDASYKLEFESSIFGFDHSFTGLSAGTYHFTILNPAGCPAGEKDYTLTEEQCPQIVIANIGITSSCSNYGEATVTVTTNAHPDHYTYSFDGVTDTTGVFDFIMPGTYTLSVTSSGGNTLQQQVIVPDLTVNKPTINYVAKNMLCNLGGEVTFTGNGDNTGGYKAKYGTNTYPFGETIQSLPVGLNNFTIINQQGCIIDTLNINIGQDKCNPVVFPNTFTPNGDGINDQFRPNPDANPSSYQLLVYNRWGALVFQSQSANNGWDGRYNGKPAPLGVYYYIATFAMPGTEKKSVSGFVTLIR